MLHPSISGRNYSGADEAANRIPNALRVSRGPLPPPRCPQQQRCPENDLPVSFHRHHRLAPVFDIIMWRKAGKKVTTWSPFKDSFYANRRLLPRPHSLTYFVRWKRWLRNSCFYWVHILYAQHHIIIITSTQNCPQFWKYAWNQHFFPSAARFLKWSLSLSCIKYKGSKEKRSQFFERDFAFFRFFLHPNALFQRTYTEAPL